MIADREALDQRAVALRIGVASAGTLALLLLVLAAVRPAMMMAAVQHVRTMLGM